MLRMEYSYHAPNKHNLTMYILILRMDYSLYHAPNKHNLTMYILILLTAFFIPDTQQTHPGHLCTHLLTMIVQQGGVGWVSLPITKHFFSFRERKSRDEFSKSLFLHINLICIYK